MIILWKLFYYTFDYKHMLIIPVAFYMRLFPLLFSCIFLYPSEMEGQELKWDGNSYQKQFDIGWADACTYFVLPLFPVSASIISHL